MFYKYFLPGFVALVVVSCSQNQPEVTVKEAQEPAIQSLSFDLVGRVEHDTTYFTEGLLFHNDLMLESTGSPEQLFYTRSLIASCDTSFSKRTIHAELDRKEYFGEGITVLNNKVYQLTYINQKGFIYQLPNYKKVGEFSYSSKEGWGLTTDGKSLIMSDGTDLITYLDPSTFKTVKTLQVKRNGLPESYLNELEFVNGFIYANIYTTNTIVKINAESGEVVAQIELSRLAEDSRNVYANSMELNGIAYNPKDSLFYVTGKCWPAIYKIKIQS